MQFTRRLACSITGGRIGWAALDNHNEGLEVVPRQSERGRLTPTGRLLQNLTLQRLVAKTPLADLLGSPLGKD